MYSSRIDESKNLDNEEIIPNVGFTLDRAAIHLAKGNIYCHKQNGDQFELIELADFNQALFKSIETLRVELLSIHDFENLPNPNGTVINVDSECISDEDWEKAQKKYFAIQPLIAQKKGYRGVDGYERRAKESGVTSRTLRRWVDAYQHTGSIASLLDKKRGWTKDKTRLDEAMNDLIKTVIYDYYLTPQRPTMQATVRMVHKRCHELGVEKPSGNAIRFRINQLSESTVLKKRGYREKAKNKFTPKTGHFPEVLAPLDVVQIDHTPVDLIIVDDKHRKPIGRPWITIAIDIYSRMITGYYISLDAPSVTSVGMCLARSILPKNELLEQNNIENITWDVFGYPEKIHVDNGSDFRSEDLRKSCALHGINIEFRPLARPEYGGHVERMIGNIMKKVHELPGTTFSNIKQRDGYDAEKNASLTLAEFEKWFLTYITKVYHQSIHSSIEKTPSEQWKIGIFGDSLSEANGIPKLPVDDITLRLDFMPSFERTIQSSGVRIEGIYYYDICLNHYVNTSDKNGNKEKYIFRQDPRDISQIWFFDPKLKQYFKIPYANQALPVMSLWEYKQLKGLVRQKYGKSNEHLIYQAWDEMQSLTENATSSTKTQRRKEQRRKHHVKSQKHYAPKEVEVFELLEEESRVSDSILDITSDDSDDGIYFYEDIE
ncbi:MULTISPECIES: Mu transposase C-terminal domain-containing protein [unclassified Psychrobacter]|uniref:Mu transposase C-terminal domain-containing protein n=2 Tax=Psychrobacter TaxID=497 RepID=UPI000B418873|nr:MULTISPECIES: Mu transposase C-terminal domain-containing protein [unclassified Psychrobacter]MBE0442127.1 DDE-type integrase/transposase/recombinase [Psychrobacter sp. FME13]MBE0444924.1 DDE-type integrase/transposase/recombinase [Psychrobacter sp. FME5]